MSYFARPGSLTKLVDAVTTVGTTRVALPRHTFGRDLLLLHTITGANTGGHSTVLLSPDGIATVPHHGGGSGLPDADTASSYSAVAHDVSETVIIELTVADGTHSVWYQFLG